MRIERPRKHNQARFELCVRERLGFSFRRKGSRFARTPLPEQETAFANFKGDVPGRLHRTYQLVTQPVSAPPLCDVSVARDA